MKRALVTIAAVGALLVGALPVALGWGAGNRPVTVTSGNLEGNFNGAFLPSALPLTKPAPVSLSFEARFQTSDSSQIPALGRLTLETDKHLILYLNRIPRCTVPQLRGADQDEAHQACQRAVVGTGQATTERPGSARPIDAGPQVLLFNGGTANRVAKLLVYISFPEAVPASVVFPIRIKKVKAGRFGLSWQARIPPTPPGLGSYISLRFKLRKGLTATCTDGLLVLGGSAGFADGKQLPLRLSRESTEKSAPARARSGIVIPLPTLSTEFSAKPTPLPDPTDGRVPVSLRLADAISTTDGSHPPAAAEVRFELDRGFRLDLAGVPRCPWAPVQGYPGFNWVRCADAVIGGGKLRWEVAPPEEEPARVGAPAVIYRGHANKLLIRTEVPAPVGGEVVIPVRLSKRTGSVYRLRAAAAVPKTAGGDGSLVYLGLRFDRGLFSVACSRGRLQAGVDNLFADGSISSAASILTC